ncbi:MAG: transposase [Patescibacteria group bacterium]
MKVLKSYIVDPTNERNGLVHILAYCVMGNHYHLIIEEVQEGGITQFMHKFGVGYANYFNSKYGRVGSLFQGRFKSVLVDNERYLQYLLVYINVLNPAEFVNPNWKEDGIQDIGAVLRFAEGYSWSSHQDYLGKRGSLILDKRVLGRMFPTPAAYLDLVHMVLDEKKYQEISHLALE